MQKITVAGREYLVDIEKFTYQDFLTLRALHDLGDISAFNRYCDDLVARLLGAEIVASVPVRHYPRLIFAVQKVIIACLDEMIDSDVSDEEDEHVRD